MKPSEPPVLNSTRISPESTMLLYYPDFNRYMYTHLQKKQKTTTPLYTKTDLFLMWGRMALICHFLLSLPFACNSVFTNPCRHMIDCVSNFSGRTLRI